MILFEDVLKELAFRIFGEEQNNFFVTDFRAADLKEADLFIIEEEEKSLVN